MDIKSKFSTIIGPVVLSVACAVGGWVACALMPKGAKMPPSGMMGRGAVTVAVTNAEERVYNVPERFVAHVEAMKEVPLVPEIEGYVKEVLFKEGDMVQEGQELYKMDAERYQAVVNQRKADLEAAEAESRRADRYYKRMQTADDRGITQLERDNAEAAYESSKAAVLQAKANLVVAEYYLKRTTVKAPISGKIGKTSVYSGDYVSPAKGLLAKIVQIDPIRVRFPMTDRAFLALKQAAKKDDNGYRLRLMLPDDSEYTEMGTLDFDDNEMSDATATISMRAKFANPNGVLVPNCYVTMLQDYKLPPKFLSVPQQSIIEITGGNQGLWVLKDDMTVEQRVVKIREAYNGWVPIMSGIARGERVVISGTGKLATGMKVNLAQPTVNDDIDPNYKQSVKD